MSHGIIDSRGEWPFPAITEARKSGDAWVEISEEHATELEAERDRVKAYNASCRKGKPDPSLLDEKQRDDLAGLVRIGFARADLTFPAYHLSNLSGNIKRQRDRLVRLERESH